MSVTHQPRLAWDGARAVVRAAGSPHYVKFANHLLESLGSEMYGNFADTRQRLLTAFVETGGDRFVADVEAGKWRVWLQKLLQEQPELTVAVLDLTTEAFEL